MTGEADEMRCPLLGAEMCEGDACQFWGPGTEDCLLAVVLERGAKLLGRILNAQDRERRERDCMEEATMYTTQQRQSQAPPDWMQQQEEIVIALEETYGVGCSYTDEQGLHVYCPYDVYREPGHVAGVYYHPGREQWVFECFDAECEMHGKDYTAAEIRSQQPMS